MSLRRTRLAPLIGGLLALLAAPAWAHAIVLEAVPDVDAAVAGPDVEVRLRFNSRIDHRRSRLTLTDAQGRSRGLAVDPDGGPAMLAGHAAGLAPGRYRLRWQVLAEDGHITRGDIPFRVGR